MVSAKERMRIYFLGGDDSTCLEAFQHFPAAAVHPVGEDQELVSRIAGADDLEIPRCLVWSLPLARGVAAHQRLRAGGVTIPTVALIDPAEAGQGPPAHSCETAFVMKPGTVPAVVDRVWNALQIDTALMPARRTRTRFQLQLSTLSLREAEVLELLITGRSTKEIGSELYIGTQTVLKHRAAVLKKLGVRNDVELALKLRQHRDAPTCLKTCEFGLPLSPGATATAAMPPCGTVPLTVPESLQLPRESA